MSMHQEVEMTSGEEITIRHPKTNQALGFVRRTFGGFYRAYSYMSGCGWGPLFSEQEARDWVYKHSKSIPNYSRNWADV